MPGVSPAERPTASARGATERVRALCTALPHVSERLSHGESTWFIDDKKSFASMSDHHHDERVSVCIAAGAGVQEDLVARDPDRYYRPPYVGARGWIGVYLDGTSAETAPDWPFIAGLIADAWLVVAPVGLHALLEGP